MDNSPSANFTVSPISFSANKSEYFKLWIVNLFLTVVTLGIYGAWAKVRNTQYLYGHTQIDGHRLSYLAQPMQILKGRLLALVIFLAYMVCIYFGSVVGVGIAIIVTLLSPVFLVNALRFNLRHTVYRNIRFGFSGSYGDAYINFLLLPLLSIFTLGLAMPWVYCRMSKFVYGNLRFGDREFQANLSSGTFYKAAIISFIVYIVPVIGGIGIVAWKGIQQQNIEGLEGMIWFYLSYFFAFLAYTISYVITRNHIFNNLKSEGLVEFRSNLRMKSYLWLTLTNLVLIVCTLGLAFPIAQVRKNLALASATEVHLTDQIDHLEASSKELDSSFGEEAASFFDSDFSLT